MHSPKLYQVRKFKFKDIIEEQFNLTIPFDMESLAYVYEQDNMFFRIVRRITDHLEVYNHFVVFVDCKGCKKLTSELNQVLREGFSINNQRFLCTEKSASMSRNAVLAFVDQEIKQQIDDIITMEISMEKTVICKYLAYRGLMFSSCFCLENWYPKVIVIDDYEAVVPNQLIKYAENVEKEYVYPDTGLVRKYLEREIKKGYHDILVNVFDGCGAMHPAITAEIRQRLGIEENPTSIMLRMPYVKGILHELNYSEYLSSFGVTHIKDIWGILHDVNEPMMILTKSMYKGLKYFKNYGDQRDWEHYWEMFVKYNHCIGIAKWNKTVEEEEIYKPVNYQILQDLPLPYDDFKMLALDSIDWAEKIINGDEVYTYCYLGLFYEKQNPSNDYMRAILKNPKMLHDPCVRKYIKNLLTKAIDLFKCGKLLLKNTHRILAPDLVMLMEHIGGLEVKGCLGVKEFYSRSIEGICKGNWLIERNPHLSLSEHVLLEGTENDLINKWLSHLQNITMINTKDTITLQRLNSADVDGDLVITMQNEIIEQGISGYNDGVTMDTEDKITAIEETFTIDNIIKSILFSMDNRIGEYSNIATGYHNKTPKTAEQKAIYMSHVDLMSILTGKEIDSAKHGVKVSPSKYISKYSKPLPYFMKYAGSYYLNMSKFNRSHSNLNRLCRDLENWHRELKFKEKIKGYDYRIMMNNDLLWDDEILHKLEVIYTEFSAQMAEFRKQQFMKRKSDHYKNYFGDVSRYDMANTEINYKHYHNLYRQKCLDVCGDVQMLANYLVYICYELYPKRDKNFAWIIAKDGIIKNLKREKVRLPKECADGEYEYMGKYYSLQEVNIYVE